jgi:hypothetical protein
MTQQQTQIAEGGEQMGGGECADASGQRRENGLDARNFGLVPLRGDGGATAGNGFARSPQMAQSEPDEATLETYNFGSALHFLKNGRRVARRGWNGKGMWLVLVPGTPGAVLQPGTPYARALGQPSCNILPHIDMWTVDASGRRAMLPGWLASQTDMLADDWVVLPNEIEPHDHPRTV